MLTRFIIILFFGLGATPLFAQEALAPAVTTAVRQVANFYQLDAEQTSEMETIFSRELRNVREIEGLRTTAPAEYLQRLRAIRKSTRAATRRLLTEEQRPLFQAAQQRERAAWNTSYKELQAQGYSDAEIELQLATQYLEEKGW